MLFRNQWSPVIISSPYLAADVLMTARSCPLVNVQGPGPNDYASTLNDQSQPWWMTKDEKSVSRAVCSIFVEGSVSISRSESIVRGVYRTNSMGLFPFETRPTKSSLLRRARTWRHSSEFFRMHRVVVHASEMENIKAQTA